MAQRQLVWDSALSTFYTQQMLQVVSHLWMQWAAVSIHCGWMMEPSQMCSQKPCNCKFSGAWPPPPLGSVPPTMPTGLLLETDTKSIVDKSGNQGQPPVIPTLDQMLPLSAQVSPKSEPAGGQDSVPDAKRSQRWVRTSQRPWIQGFPGRRVPGATARASAREMGL